MSDKAKKILYLILDIALTYGGTAGVIVYNYVSPTNSLGYKMTLTGIVLVVAFVLFIKARFEKNYQKKMDNYLQELARATDTSVKEKISAEIDKLKLANQIYQKVMILLPFALVCLVAELGAASMKSLGATSGLILISLGGGSIFNILKNNISEKIAIDKLKEE